MNIWTLGVYCMKMHHLLDFFFWHWRRLYMKTTSIYGLALIIGSIGLTVTMIFHPTGTDIQSVSAGNTHAVQIAILTHSLAIGSIPLCFFGFLGLSRILGSKRPAIQGALILLGLSYIAGMCAAVYSGFGSTSLAKQILKTSDASSSQILQSMLQYNGYLNQGFAKVMFVSLAASIVLWSACLLRFQVTEKLMGIAGILIGGAGLATFLIGTLRLDVHGFGIFVFAQTVWTISLGLWMVQMRKGRDPDDKLLPIN